MDDPPPVRRTTFDHDRMLAIVAIAVLPSAKKPAMK
jgi:hypothetical protein